VAALADRGHTVIAVELNPTDVGYAQDLLKVPSARSLTVMEA
jgi:predicted RNA methylase